MSYDLYAWREERDLGLSPEEAMDKLAKEGEIPGFVGIPVADITAAFRKVFPEIEDGNTELNWEGAGSYFQVTFGYEGFRVANSLGISCGFQLLKAPEEFDKLVGVLHGLGCKVFDPQRAEYL